jgi:hypothetical protein
MATSAHTGKRPAVPHTPAVADRLIRVTTALAVATVAADAAVISSAANYIAQISGQAPNLASQSDCPVWTPFPGQAVAGPYHQILGTGCVYPATVQTLGGQLSAAGHSWAAYLQDMGNDPARDHTVTTARGPACGHPPTWAPDHTQRSDRGSCGRRRDFTRPRSARFTDLGRPSVGSRPSVG